MFYFADFFGKKVLKSTLLDGLEHFFTTRDFVLHSGNREDLTETATCNVDFLREKLGLSESQLYRCQQRHTNNVAVASHDSENFFENTDGIVLTEKNTAAFLNFADCIPIIMYDFVENIGAVVHAGWRGTASKIQQKAVEIMCQKGSTPENIKAAIGAGIGICCFDVNEDVFEQIMRDIDLNYAKSVNAYKESKEKDKYFIDLKKVNEILLNQVSVKQIDTADYCTSCSTDVFFSYRKENGNTARHSAVLKIRG
ncbi:MAG: peptidoglycan editing factor PgeF [Candidatus Gastranaerophilales bacterium]|nr:peptidoglycan editing factor PgeF [Candidatus Gastranaerophilales bacterium]